MGGREADEAEQLTQAIRQGSLTSKELLASYCRQLYQALGSYDAVGQKVDLDWRTVKKYVEAWVVIEIIPLRSLQKHLYSRIMPGGRCVFSIGYAKNLIFCWRPSRS
jgi:hypothetical protein